MKRLIIFVASTMCMVAGAAQAGGFSQRISADVGMGMYRTVPPPDMLLVMAVGHGNMVNDYAVVWKLAAKSFQKKFDGAMISRLLEPIRSVGLNHHALTVVTPQFQEVRIDDAGSLRLAGVFALQPRRLEFRLLFEAEEDGWRLAGMAFAVLPPAVVPPLPPQAGLLQPRTITLTPLAQPLPLAKPATVAPEVKPKRADASGRLEDFSRSAIAGQSLPQRPALDQLAPSSVADLRNTPLISGEVAVVSSE
jgi:hypothetical protein